MAQIAQPQKKEGDPMGKALMLMQMGSLASGLASKSSAADTDTPEPTAPSSVSGTNNKATPNTSDSTAMSRRYQKMGGYA